MLPVPEPLVLLWRSVIAFREHLRKKKQEYATHSGSGVGHTLTQSMIAATARRARAGRCWRT